MAAKIEAWGMRPGDYAACERERPASAWQEQAAGPDRLSGLAAGLKKLLWRSWAIALFLLLWEAAPRLGLVNALFIPPLSVVLSEMVTLTLSGVLPSDALISLQRVALGFLLALAVALPLGFLLGAGSGTFEEAVGPLLQVLGQANPFTLIPVSMALLGIGEISKIGIIFWVCQWPLLFNTVAGIRNTDPALVKAARSLKMSSWGIFTRVMLPASLSTIFAGIRISFTLAFFMLIGAEMIGASSGLGFLIIQSQATYQVPQMYAGIVTVALLGIAINGVVLALERYVARWNEGIRG